MVVKTQFSLKNDLRSRLTILVLQGGVRSCLKTIEIGRKQIFIKPSSSSMTSLICSSARDISIKPI